MNLFISALVLSVLAVEGADLPGEEQYLSAYRAESAGRFGDAVGGYAACVDADGHLASYAKVRGAVARARGGDTKGGIQALEEVIDGDSRGPWIPFAQYQLGMLYAQAERYSEASAAFWPALTTDARLWWLGDYEDVAARSYIRVVSSAARGYDYFRRVVDTTGYIAPRAAAAAQLATSPSVADRIRAVDGLLRGRKGEDAIALLDELKGLDGLEGSAVNALALAEAQVSIHRKKLDAGAVLLERVAESSKEIPRLSKVYVDLVRAYCREGRFDRAEDVAKRMEDLFGSAYDVGEARWRIGEAFAAKNNPAEAIATFGALVEDFPEHGRAPKALRELGVLYSEQGKRRNALRAFDRVVAEHARSGEAPEAGYRAGELLAKAGDTAGAIARFEGASRLGFGSYYGHRAEVRHRALKESAMVSLPHMAGERVPIVQPRAGMAGPLDRGEALDGDERFARLRFFSSYGMPESEWEVLGMWDTLGEHAEPGPLYLAIARAGTAYSAMQIANANHWGVGEDGTPTRERLQLRFPLAYWPSVHRLAAETGVDPFLILSVARQESTYRPALSSIAGARGVMQLMPATARWIAESEAAIPDSSATNLENPQSSLRLGAYYLKRMLARSKGNVVYALASYNAGPGNSDKWRRRFGEVTAERFIDRIPFGETQEYVKHVLGFYAAYHSLYSDLPE